MNHSHEIQSGRARTRRLENPPRILSERAAPGRECWSVRRVATYFDVTPKRIYQFIEQGRLESLRLGPRQIRIPRRSIDAFLAECDPNAEA